MYPVSLKTIQLRKLACSVLLAMIVFQLGACPCGCLEHNAWFQMLGFGDHDHGLASTDGVTSVQDAGHDDCTGELAAAYVDNSRLLNRDPASRSAFETSAPDNQLGDTTTPDLRALQPNRDDLAIMHAPALSALQVYRL